MKDTYWAGLFHIAVFTLLAVLTPRSLTAGRAGDAKTNAIRGEPYLNKQLLSASIIGRLPVARTCLKAEVSTRRCGPAVK